jgi:PAS domain S-box-containing protein
LLLIKRKGGRLFELFFVTIGNEIALIKFYFFDFSHAIAHRFEIKCWVYMNEKISPDSIPKDAASTESLSFASKVLRYRRLFDSAQDGILIINYKTNLIEDANPFFCKLIDFSSDEIIGKHLWDIAAVIDKNLTLTSFAILQDKGYVRYEDVLMAKGNRVVNVEVVNNIYGINGERVIQCSFRDITQRVESDKKIFAYQVAVNLAMREMVDAFALLTEGRDPYTAGHQARVADLAVAMANQLGLPHHELDGIEISSLIHDIGKFSIPSEVLTKSVELNTFEMAMLRNHVQAGYDVLKHLHFPWPVAKIVLQHHERLDGSGYPNGLSGDSICIESRILAVADTVDAMTSSRPYRPAKGLNTALMTITAGSGKIFDERVVGVCLKLFRDDGYKFPEILSVIPLPDVLKHL